MSDSKGWLVLEAAAMGPFQSRQRRQKLVSLAEDYYPMGTDGHTHGENCPCRPQVRMDAEGGSTVLLVHNKLLAAPGEVRRNRSPALGSVGTLKGDGGNPLPDNVRLAVGFALLSGHRDDFEW